MLDWQQWVLEEALMEDHRGKWSAFEVALVVARQNGKNAILEALELADLFLFEARTVVHSAHKFDTAQEHFLRMRTLIESSDELMDLMPDDPNHGFITSNGKEQIRLRSGARLKFIARARGGGRGYSGDRIVFDEAWELPARAMGAMLPTLRARPHTQVWYTSSGAMPSSTMLQSLIARGRNGEVDDRLFFAEWGNEQTALNDDLEAWYRANPSLGCSTSNWAGIAEEAMWNEYRSLVAGGDQELIEEFRRECLGVSELPTGQGSGVIDLAQWASLVEAGSRIESHRQWSVAVSPDRKWSTIGVAGRRADGRSHVEWMDRRPGTAWVVDAVAAAWESAHIPIRIHKSGPEGSLIAPLRERGVEVVEVSSAEVAQATAQLIDAVAAGTVRHLGQGSLDVAVRGAVLRMSSDGAALWSQRQSSVDITALVAVTVALGGLPVGTVDLVANIW